MVKEFYKSGDCTKTASIKLVSAKAQLESAEEKQDTANKEYWTSFVSAIIDRINQIWRIGVCTIWEEEAHNMPGFEDLLKDISNAGYHVYCTKSRKPHDVNDQNLYTITLDTPPQKEMYGEEMTFVKNDESKEENN